MCCYKLCLILCSIDDGENFQAGLVVGNIKKPSEEATHKNENIFVQELPIINEVESVTLKAEKSCPGTPGELVTDYTCLSPSTVVAKVPTAAVASPQLSYDMLPPTISIPHSSSSKHGYITHQKCQ